jgi:hypothetical protein
MADPRTVFLRQVEAFNAHDLDAFVATYAPDATVNGLPGGAVTGHAALRDLYADRFRAGPRCEVPELHVLADRWVVAHERIAGPAGTAELVGVFEVERGRIVRADMSARHSISEEEER